jgi:hypothetical protein
MIIRGLGGFTNVTMGTNGLNLYRKFCTDHIMIDVGVTFSVGMWGSVLNATILC